MSELQIRSFPEQQRWMVQTQQMVLFQIRLPFFFFSQDLPKDSFTDEVFVQGFKYVMGERNCVRALLQGHHMARCV